MIHFIRQRKLIWGNQAAVQLQDVTVHLGDRSTIDGLNLEVGEGEFVTLVGPTGCGKSTLLHVIAGLLPLSRGQMCIAPNHPVGYLFQQETLLPWKTALDNIAIGLVFHGTSFSKARQQAQPWLKKVGLKGFEYHYPHQLSGGMKKRLSLAQVLILNPRILLMDEPFSALDPQTRGLMENELLRLWQEDKKSVLFVTHDLEEAVALSDRVVVLSAGPESKPIGEYTISLPRPRDVTEIRLTEPFLEIYRMIWTLLKKEVLKSYAQQT